MNYGLACSFWLLVTRPRRLDSGCRFDSAFNNLRLTAYGMEDISAEQDASREHSRYSKGEGHGSDLERCFGDAQAGSRVRANNKVNESVAHAFAYRLAVRRMWRGQAAPRNDPGDPTVRERSMR